MTLKTWETDYDASKIGCLPYGLKQVVRKSISGNAYKMSNFHSISELKDHEFNYFSICSKNSDNMISLLKKAKGKEERSGMEHNST